MKVLVIGCGFVGARAADLLHAAGHEVFGVTHSTTSAERLAAEKPWPVLTCDVSSLESVQALRAQAGPVDALIHCASSGRGGAAMYQTVYVDGMRHLVTAWPDAWPLYTAAPACIRRPMAARWMRALTLILIVTPAGSCVPRSRLLWTRAAPWRGWPASMARAAPSS